MPRIRVSVRLLMALVLALACLLGWLDHKARVQKRAVAAIRAVRGTVEYDWAFGLGYLHGSNKPDSQWIVRALGIDYVASVTEVGINRVLVRQPADQALDDSLLAEIGRLTDTQSLWIIVNDMAATSEGFQHLRSLKKLKTLSLQLGGTRPIDLALISGFEALEELRIAGAGLSDQFVSQITNLTKLTRLTLLPYPGPGPGISDDGMSHLSKLTSLRHLQLDCNPITSAGLTHLHDMNQLETLILSITKVEDLGPIRSLGRLRFLQLNDTPMSDKGLAAVAGFSRLDFLGLQGTSVGDVGLGHIRHLAGLKDLDVGRTKVTVSSLDVVSKLGKLESLNLAQADVNDEAILKLTSCVRLGALMLWNTRLTDAGLAKLAAMPSLNRVHVGWTQVTPAGRAAAMRPGLLILD